MNLLKTLAVAAVVALVPIGCSEKTILKTEADIVTELCHDAVRSVLKSPITAQFRSTKALNLSAPGVTKPDWMASSETYWMMASTVDSQNSFGAMLRTTFLCESDGQKVRALVGAGEDAAFGYASRR